MLQKAPKRARLSAAASASPRSGIRDVFDRLERYEDVISFAVGEPSFTAPHHVAQAGQVAISQGRTHYTNVLGIPELRRAIAGYSQRVKGLTYDPASEIQAVPGATLGLYLALRAIADPGDEILLCTPHFASYDAQIVLASATPVHVALRAENAMRMDADDIAAAITDRTRAIIINSPSNPTGAVTPASELARIGDVCRDHGLWVISDEVYHPFVYGEATENSSSKALGKTPSAASIAAIPGMKERTVVVDSLSKTYAMTGWRIGYMLGPADLIAETSKIAETINSSNNAPAQYAAVAALTGLQTEVDEMRAQYARRRQIVIDALRDCPELRLVAPEGAFYAFVDVRGTGLGSREFSERLLDEFHVAVIPGEAFGSAGDGFVRISYAGNEDDIASGMARIVEFARSLGDPSR
ncbi:pyridoxal phosphate-dependent aminotransferase [Rarobacter faecitabidus]|uniref:Aminotransferase n=1 Tax=Rarobacter faecitabidus TaxID=13243 RepID=A0A542ZAM2_RARFA|nr:pyridoxal phosphate-dependent aminotransferase [Rarobacter faecitabidus]TQL57365.1 aminotransferase [Rarobacter faecitabidus]